MEAAENGGDLGIGVGVGLGLVTVGGALAMFLEPGSIVAGWGFALAMAAGSLAVVAAQLYG